MSSKTITLTYPTPSIALITLSNPQKLNALTAADYFLLSTHLRTAAASPAVTVTILTGKGRFFSAGADVTAPRLPGADTSSPREHFLRGFVANNLELTHAFHSHPKILITALNGPAVGLSAAMTAYSDFVYAAPHAYLLTPFTSLGLVAEGGASKTFVERLGISKANEALIMSKKISAAELVGTGYVNKVFEGVKPGEDGKFLELVMGEVKERLLGGHLNEGSLVRVKELIRRPGRQAHEAQMVAEVLGGLERFVGGEPQREFEAVASGRKKHKL
ncbi:hypothetical protein MMC10_007957 [Thelotrema lepadinum]|nr:hypothetical protein [Thelotrema lepadinum]